MKAFMEFMYYIFISLIAHEQKTMEHSVEVKCTVIKSIDTVLILVKVFI